MFKTSLEYYFIHSPCRLKSKENKPPSTWTGYANKGNMSSIKEWNDKKWVREREKRWILKEKTGLFWLICFVPSSVWTTKTLCEWPILKGWGGYWSNTELYILIHRNRCLHRGYSYYRNISMGHLSNIRFLKPVKKKKKKKIQNSSLLFSCCPHKKKKIKSLP